MRHSIYLAAIALLLVACQSRAEVTNAGAAGFTTVNEVVIGAKRQRAWSAAVDEIGRWWHPDHTISGDAARLSIDARTLGCFCESLGGDGAGVVHLSVTMVNPGVVLRMTGGLGPLGLMGANGNMTWEFNDVEGGTRVRFTYAVGGYHEQGMDTLAGPVDFVVGEALLRLKSYVESSDPANAVGD